MYGFARKVRKTIKQVGLKKLNLRVVTESVTSVGKKRFFNKNTIF